METIVVGYDGTCGADSCVRILERDHQRVAAQLERAGRARESAGVRKHRRDMRELLIRVENGRQCRELESFLRDRRARPRGVDEHTLAVDLDEDSCPGLATLVAAVEEWRGSSHAGEASLELDGEIRILRTEI